LIILSFDIDSFIEEKLDGCLDMRSNLRDQVFQTQTQTLPVGISLNLDPSLLDKPASRQARRLKRANHGARDDGDAALEGGEALDEALPELRALLDADV
jgi:hypothetical protein